MKRLAKPKPRLPASCPCVQPPGPPDAVLRTCTGERSRSWRRLGLGRVPSLPPAHPLSTPLLKAEPEATPRSGAQEARRVGGECCGLGPSSRAGGQASGCGRSLTERTLMRIGVSNRHAILSLPTRLQPAPAPGPALSTADYWANHSYLCRKAGR